MSGAQRTRGSKSQTHKFEKKHILIIIWFGYLQLIGPQSLGSIVVVSLCVLLLIWFGYLQLIGPQSLGSIVVVSLCVLLLIWV